MNACDERSKLHWQCRRGLKELDVMLVTYLEHYYAQAAEDEKQQFQALLLLEDPVLALLLLSEKKGLSYTQDCLLKKLRMVARQRLEL